MAKLSLPSGSWCFSFFPSSVRFSSLLCLASLSFCPWFPVIFTFLPCPLFSRSLCFPYLPYFTVFPFVSRSTSPLPHASPPLPRLSRRVLSPRLPRSASAPDAARYAELLVSTGCSLNAANVLGETPLVAAARDPGDPCGHGSVVSVNLRKKKEEQQLWVLRWVVNSPTKLVPLLLTHSHVAMETGEMGPILKEGCLSEDPETSCSLLVRGSEGYGALSILGPQKGQLV